MKKNFTILFLTLSILNLGFSVTKDTYQNAEYMDPGKMRINNKLPLFTSVKKLEAIVGKPDSIRKIMDWDGICQSGIRDANSTFRYYGHTSFESFNDSVSLESIDFRQGSKFFIQYGKLRLDSNSTEAYLQTLFPESFKDFNMVTTDGIIGMIKLVSIPQAKEMEVESMWVLLFQNGKLIRIDNWLPC